VLSDQAGDVANAVYVGVSIFLAEAEPFSRGGPDLVAIERGDFRPYSARRSTRALATYSSEPRGREPDGQPLAELRRARLVRIAATAGG